MKNFNCPQLEVGVTLAFEDAEEGSKVTNALNFDLCRNIVKKKMNATFEGALSGENQLGIKKHTRITSNDISQGLECRFKVTNSFCGGW